MTTLRDTLAADLAQVEQRIAAACARAGRARTDVTLVAVTKSVSAALAGLLAELGVVDLGENRPQELWRKAGLLSGSIRWHLIGHLQRNKIERTLPLVHRLHAVDSLRLLTAIEAAATGLVSVMLEVNCSGESAKQGFAPEELAGLVPTLRTLRRVSVVGLMTMAAYAEDPQTCRPTFALLRRLRDELRGVVGETHPLTELSMGMSNDFEVAIEEGATLIRLGTVLFAGLPQEDGP